jgi:hypothetical protein
MTVQPAAAVSAIVSDMVGGTPDPMPGSFIETYYADGAWHSRRHDADAPFASDEDKLDQIAAGTQVARWNNLPHIVRTRTGAIAEILDP